MIKLTELINVNPSIRVCLTLIPNVGWTATISGIELSSGRTEVTVEHPTLVGALDLLALRLAGRHMTVIETGQRILPYKYTGF